MSVIEEALQGHLEGHAGLSALVSNRVYPMVGRQNTTLPYATYQLIDGESLARHGGQMGKANPVFQITVWASTYATAKAVAEQVKLAMIAFIGTFSGIVVDAVDISGARDMVDDETRALGVSRDFSLIHAEAVA